MNDKNQLAALGADIAQQQEPMCMAKQVEQLQELLIESLRGRRVGPDFVVRCAQVCDVGLVEGLHIDGGIDRDAGWTDADSSAPTAADYLELQAQHDQLQSKYKAAMDVVREINDRGFLNSAMDSAFSSDETDELTALYGIIDTLLDDQVPEPSSDADSILAELHMGDAMSVFAALKVELLSETVLRPELGAMGAERVEVWSSKTGHTLEMCDGNGGCTLVIRRGELQAAVVTEAKKPRITGVIGDDAEFSVKFPSGSLNDPKVYFESLCIAGDGASPAHICAMLAAANWLIDEAERHKKFGYIVQDTGFDAYHDTGCAWSDEQIRLATNNWMPLPDEPNPQGGEA